MKKKKEVSAKCGCLTALVNMLALVAIVLKNTMLVVISLLLVLLVSLLGGCRRS